MMRIAALTIPLVLFAGCASSPVTQQSYQRPTAADDPSVRCFTEMQSDPRFTVLYEKTPSTVEGMSLEMTTDASRVTEDEKRALSLFVAARQACHAAGESFRRTSAPPGWAEENTKFQGRYLDLVADLYSGSSTWGEFNRRRRELSGETRSRLMEISNRDHQQRMQQYEADRQSALNTYLMLRSMQPQPAPITLTAPRPAVNCTTRYIGATAYTSCQ